MNKWLVIFLLVSSSVFAQQPPAPPASLPLPLVQALEQKLNEEAGESINIRTMLVTEQRKNDDLQKEIDALQKENEALKKAVY